MSETFVPAPDGEGLAAPRMRRVGHKGADHISPGNTPASFDAALQAGVDMIEFDVLSEAADGSGRLLLAHDYEALRSRSPVSLQDGLSHLAGSAFADVDLDVDLKLPGYELRVLDALREAGLIERTLVSSMYRHSLAILRHLEPRLRLGWSVPHLRRDYTTEALTMAPALAVLSVYRAWLPRLVSGALRAGRCDALMAHWRLVTPRLVRAVARGGGELYAWTVDDACQIARLEQLGVSGIISNDPRLFGYGG